MQRQNISTHRRSDCPLYNGDLDRDGCYHHTPHRYLTGNPQSHNSDATSPRRTNRSASALPKAYTKTAPNPLNPARNLGRIVAALLCVAIIIFAGRSLAQGVIAISSSLSAAGTSSNISTPASEWHKGSIPYLYQTDPSWADTPYAGSTLGKAGCGPTCLSMVAIGLTGRADLNPVNVAAFAENNGYLIDGLTSWELMTSGAAQLGLSSEVVPAESATVLRLLANDYPIIASMLPGDFTSEGHFIVLAGVGEDEDSVLVRDPNSPERSAETWDLDTILSQAANLWVFSIA